MVADQMVVDVLCSSHILIVTMALDHAALVKSLLAAARSCLALTGAARDWAPWPALLSALVAAVRGWARRAAGATEQ